MAAMVSPWGKPGAWALDSEEHEAQLLKEQELQKQAELSLDFPSLNDALATKQKKKGQTLSLAEFNTYGSTGSRSSSQSLRHEDLMVLPTGPRQRTAEELDRNRLGGGFRNYGSNGSYERNNRYSNGDDSSNSKWGSSRVSDENRRNGNGSNRADSSKEFTSSRADEVDNWALTKKPMAGNGFERRERGVGFSDSQSSKADESESWVSNKTNVPSDGRRFGANGGFDRERRGGFTASGGGADSDNWGRKKEEGNTGGVIGSRPKLNLQPRTLPVSDGKSSEISGTAARSKSSNPFGAARPREEVLAEKGHDWKKLDEQLESKIKEVSVEEKTEKSNAISFGKKSFGNGKSRAGEDRTEKSWRKPESPLQESLESRPDSGEENEIRDCEGERDGDENGA
ncbi:eukaryotic translation initiation factor 4B3-like isoform X1 [Benincasa hispida]|uniref:eukaryotic translation initiation factor 4B3-like isoform X1 n=1 Tax=Benincasa hispida TaxID=102211 RepID=UPI001901F4D4|nr:eukaryotic translation initiation factor 4B3-like isoform X1 [Benincasa hispida]